MLPLLLFTDFGLEGPYQGQMRLVLNEALPGCEVIDLVTNAPRMQPRAAAYLLAALAGEIRRESVFVAVVDPGVGGDRAGLVMQADRHWLVGPDNGLLSVVASQAKSLSVWRSEEPTSLHSKTFHGRDWFAPVAAGIAAGRPNLGEQIDPTGIVGAGCPPDLFQVVYVDHYGNLFTGIRASGLDRRSRLKIAGRLASYAATFCEVPVGQAFWYENSCGLVEVAVNQGRADCTLGASLGDKIELVAAGAKS